MTLVHEHPFVGSNKIVLNVEPFLRSIGVGDAVANVVMISEVDSQPINIVVALTGDASSTMPELKNEYDMTFGDEWAEDSADDRLVLELSNRCKVLLHRGLMKHATEVPDCWDLSEAHRVVDDGLHLDDNVSLINCDNVII
jgi:hypothetical protein